MLKENQVTVTYTIDMGMLGYICKIDGIERFRSRRPIVINQTVASVSDRVYVNCTFVGLGKLENGVYHYCIMIETTVAEKKYMQKCISWRRKEWIDAVLAICNDEMRTQSEIYKKTFVPDSIATCARIVKEAVAFAYPRVDFNIANYISREFEAEFWRIEADGAYDEACDEACDEVASV